MSINKVLKDIKHLGQSLEEIENVMVKEVCSRSGYSINSFAELKSSIIDNKQEKYDTQQSPRKQEIDCDSKNQILDEVNKNKDEMIQVIDTVRTEIYDNLDDILQSHVTALEEKKLLLTQEEPDRLDAISSAKLKDFDTRLSWVEEQISTELNQSQINDKINNIIEHISQLQQNKSDTEDVNRALEDIYKILEEKFIDSPVQIKND